MLKFYELGHGGQQLLATSENFNDERGQKTIVSKIKLDKKQMGVNKELLMTIEDKGKVSLRRASRSSARASTSAAR